MPLCPYCREDSVSETTRLQIRSPEPKGCLGLIVWTVISVLKLVPFIFFVVGIGLIAKAFMSDFHVLLCFTAILPFCILIQWRKWIPGIWFFVFRLLSLGTPFLEANESAHYVYDRNCRSCGATWSRSSYESWVDIHLSANCSLCRLELATAPILAARCVYCGFKDIEILEASRPIFEKQSRTIQHWLQSKDVMVDDVKQKDFFHTLIEDGSPYAIELLSEFATLDIGEGVQRIVTDWLEKLENQQAIDAVCCVWSATRSEKLSQILSKNSWVASEPGGVRVFTALKVGHLDVARSENPEVLEAIARACDDEDPLIAKRAQQIFLGFDDEIIREALYGLFLKRDYPFARKVAIEAGYVPKDERQRALFFLMTEQWEQYDLLDFDRQFLRASYMTDQSLQPRIREKLRKSGRVDFLPAIAGEDIHSHVIAMDHSEIDLIFHTYISNQEWDSLWKLAFEVPFIWSVRIIRELKKHKWQPVRTDVQNAFRDLAALADHNLPLNEEEIFRLFPPVQLKAQAKVVGRINAVAFSPIQPVIAVGTGARKVIVWNYQDAKREHVIGGFSHSIGQVVYTGNGVLLSAERTNERFMPCSVSGWDREQQFQLGVHEGSVTALAQVGKSQAISAGRDGGLILWDIPSQSIISQRETFYANRWVRTVCVTPDARKAALLHEGVELVALPNLSEEASGSIRGKKARCAIFLPDGKTLAAGMFDGRVWLFESSPGEHRLLRKGLSIKRHKDKVEGIGVLNRQNVLVTASYDGEIRFVGLKDQNVIGRYEAPLGRVTSLHISPNGYFMVVGSSESMLSFWDLMGLNLQWLLIESFAEASVTDLPILEGAMRKKDLIVPARAALNFIERILHHRFRYDIEIGEVPSIMMGEFDIEID
jgi:WD40 repeat protein